MTQIEKIASHMRDRIDSGIIPPGGRLPTIRAIAKELGVSTQTVQKALSALCSRSIIHKSLVGNRYRAGALADCDPAWTAETAARLPRADEVACQLTKEITEGTIIAGGALPSAKELIRRMRCSHATLRDALRQIEMRGYVCRVGRRYEVLRAALSEHIRSRFFLVGREGLLGRFGSHGPLLLKSIQTGLQANDAGPLQLFFTRNPETFAQEHQPQLCSGYIFPRLQPDQDWLRFLRNQSGVPTVLIDLSEAPHVERGGRSAPWFHIHSDNANAGSAVGQHLYRLGHRKIAVFSYIAPDISWVSARIKGLREIFGADSQAVSIFVPDTSQPLAKFDTINAQSTYFIRVLARSLQRSHHLATVRLSIGSWVGFSRVWTRMAPLFKQALDDQSITAWVFMNDDWALPALEFLREREVAVPQRVSIASFDNSLEAYAAGLTSYDFRFDAIGYAAVRFLLGPRTLGAHSDRHITIAGQLIERESTGR